MSPFSADEISQINDILQTTGLIEKGDFIESNPDAPASASSGLEPAGFKNWWKERQEDICKAGCSTAEAAAVAACSGLSGGTAIAVCIAAAHAAGSACRDAC